MPLIFVTMTTHVFNHINFNLTWNIQNACILMLLPIWKILRNIWRYLLMVLVKTDKHSRLSLIFKDIFCHKYWAPLKTSQSLWDFQTCWSVAEPSQKFLIIMAVYVVLLVKMMMMMVKMMFFYWWSYHHQSDLIRNLISFLVLELIFVKSDV